MNVNEPDTPEEQHVEALAACDEALAAGQRPENLDLAGVAPEARRELQRDLAVALLVRRVLRPGEPPKPDTPPLAAEPATVEAPLPGTRLGRFEVRRELGRGGFGVVFLAYDPELRREVALKVPRAEFVDNPQLRQRFLREGRVAAGLDHPNLVPVYEVGVEGPVPFLVSAYCPGLDLAAWLRQRSEPVPFALAARLVQVMAGAVQHAHERGVVHRDLKPANVLLQGAAATSPTGAANESDLIPRVTDFGLARLLEGAAGGVASGHPTAHGAVLGTPSYMAPEQARGRGHEADASVDVYALGAILYELLTGRPPFRGESDGDTLIQVMQDEPVEPSALRPQVPRDLETICLKCLEKDPQRRYASAQELADDLRRYGAGEPIRARPVSTVERGWRWCRRNKALSAAYGIAALAVVAVVVLSIGLALYQAWTNQRLTESAAALREEQQQAERARQTAEAHAILAERRSALMALDQGLVLCEQGRAHHGMLWLVRSLEIAARLPPADGSAIARTAHANLAWWSREATVLTAQFPQGNRVRFVTFRSPSNPLVTVAEDGTLQRWENGAPLGPPLFQGPVASLDVSPDGKTLAAGGTDRMVRLWDLETGKPRDQPLPHQGAVYGVAFSPDGRYLLTGSDDGKAQLWDVASGKPFGPPLVHPGTLWAVAYSPDGKAVLTGCEDGIARLWETATGKPVRELLVRQGIIWAVAWSPDGRTVLTGSTEHTAQLWDPATGNRHGPALRHQGPVTVVAYSPDSQTIATGGQDRMTRLWETTTGRPKEALVPRLNGVGCLAFSPDGRSLFVGGGVEPARLWQVPSGSPPALLLRHPGAVRAAAFSPDSRTLGTGCQDGKARLWDAASGKATGPVFEHRERVLAVAFRSDGGAFLTGSADHTVRLWHPVTGVSLGVCLAHPDKVFEAAFSPDGRFIFTGSADGYARLWDAATGKVCRPLLEHDDGVEGVAYSPDGRWLLTGSADKRARLWNAATGELAGLFNHPAPLSCVAFGPDGKTILTGSKDANARLWQVSSRSVLGPVLPHRGTVSLAAYSPDSSTLLTGSLDRTARLWDAGTRRPIGPPLLHPHEVQTVAFAPDGRRFATGCSDNQARLWRVPDPVDAEPGMVRLGVEVATGMELDEEGVVHVLSAPEWSKRRREHEQKRDVPAEP